MLRKILIKNFKCFDELILPLKGVNILTGINGMGKSTVLQSLLLLRQSFQREGRIDGLSLNGRYIHLGSAQDVLYEKAIDEVIELGISEEQDEMCFQCRYVPDSDYLPLVSAAENNYHSALFEKGFTYLSAYRIEPKDLYQITNEENVNCREFGNNGEFALQYLNLHGNEDICNRGVIIEDKLGTTLGNQTRVWMDKIAPGVAPKVTLNSQLRTSEVRYEFIEGKEKTNSYKSVNVGFGITYVLPLIITLLSAKAGDVIVLENPEAHIHPAGQRMLGELLARLSTGGVQLFVETHSDHIINGLRLAVKHGIADQKDIGLTFFYKDAEDGFRHKYVQPEIYSDGRLSIWPEGFFDEWDKALYELF